MFKSCELETRMDACPFWIVLHARQSRISHECGLYLLAAVKFVYDFFPKEQYAPEYTSVHKALR